MDVDIDTLDLQRTVRSLHPERSPYSEEEIQMLAAKVEPQTLFKSNSREDTTPLFAKASREFF